MPGFISFSVMANKGDSLVVMPSEKLDNVSNREFSYVCREGKNEFISPNLSSYRYIRMKLFPGSSLEIDHFRGVFSSYPVQYRGAFTCSDPFYNQLWDISRRTTQMCMNDMFYDSPKHQEPIACTGDYFIESISNYYAFGDPWLVRQNLIQTARMLEKNDYQLFHTSYSLLWIQMMAQYFQHTGDKFLVKQLMPYVDQLLARFSTYLDENCLLSNAPNYMFMDWINIKEFSAHHPPAVIGMGYLTAFYYKGLIDAAEMHRVINDIASSQNYTVIAEKVKAGINSQLWVKDKGLYKDGIPFITSIKLNSWMPADQDLVTYSPHINTLAVLYDIAPEEQQTTLMNYVVNQKEYELQPYFMSYVLAALKHTGNIDEGLRQIDLWENAIDTITCTLKENWQDVTASGFGGDFSHAWGGSPLYFPSQNILGISPLEPGYEIIGIDPFVGTKVTWTKGTVPVGDCSVVTVSWEKHSAENYSHSVVIPKNYKAILNHPVPFQDFKISVNGKYMKILPQGMALSPGDYIIQYTV